jgi:signal peptidase I
MTSEEDDLDGSHWRDRQKNNRSRNMKTEKKEEKEKSMIREILSWILYIVIVIALTYVVVTYVGQRTEVKGESMMKTLSDGDNLIVDKISYRFRDPERYDIIVFPFAYEEDTYYIKRIIGLPGETISIVDGYVYINGEPLGEDYGREVMMDYDGTAYEMDPVELGEDEYFVLGDNRNNSTDSRDPSVGVLTRDDLIGRAWIRIWPLSDFGVIENGND